MTVEPSLRRACLAEAIGTCVLVFFGTGAVHAAVLAGAQSGLWQVAIVWGVAISLAIYATGAVSGAHMNPAITMAFVAFRGFPVRRAPWYIAAQLAGAIAAAAILYTLFAGILAQFEASHGIVRGQAGSELSAMVYGEYFPNPSTAASMKWSPESVSHLRAMLAEGLGTAFLAFFVFAVTDSKNRSGPGNNLLPLFIGLTVSILISVLAPLTQAGLNPARDFGPRLFSYFAGWGSIAIPGPRSGWLTVYILAPMLGSLAGAAVYEYAIRRSAVTEDSDRRTQAESQIGASSMKPTRLMLVGGFLGAGKTTLLWQAARRLAARGQRVGLITNDQAPDLVDTGLLEQQGFEVREVAGSCFCCNFNALVDSATSLREAGGADILIAEPVGSCTDLSATILQPLKDRYKREFVTTPFSVLADPFRLLDVLGGTPSLHTDAAYIFLKQLEEADCIVINKQDLLTSADRKALDRLLAERLPGRSVRFISALTGEGVDDWLEGVLAGGVAGGRIVEIDYDRYAHGEAVLGWLNATSSVTAGKGDVDWPEYGRRLLETMKSRFAERSAAIGHVKLLLVTSGGNCVGNLTRSDGAVSVRGELAGSPSFARLTVNARVEMSPIELERIVRDTLDRFMSDQVAVRIDQMRSLSPGRPKPTHRYAEVV